MKQLIDVLPETQFVRINQGLIVNMEFVTGIKSNVLYVNNNIELPISRANKKAVTALFNG